MRFTARPTSLEPEAVTVTVKGGALMVMLADAEASLPLASVAFARTV